MKVSLPSPVWESSEDDAIKWNCSVHSANRYDYYWISRNLTCYFNCDGYSFPICRDAKSLDEAKAVCWSHYLGELGATPLTLDFLPTNHLNFTTDAN